MTEENPIMSLLLDHNSFVGPAETIEAEVMPMDSQLNLVPGDHAFVATANTPLERDWVIVTVLDPYRYIEAFPDMDERMMASFLLCEADSMEGRDTYVGWFSRLKLVPITEEQFQLTRDWLPNNWPNLVNDPPSWVQEQFDAFSDELSKRAPNRVPTPVKCKNCGGRQVLLEIYRRVEYKVRCGTILRGDVEKIVPMADVEENENYVARLHCTNPDCGTYADVKDEEWELRGIYE